MAEQDFDLTEAATPYKLEEARKRGTVAKSADLTAAVILIAMVSVLYASGWDGIRQSVRLEQAILARASHLEWSADGIAIWIGQLFLNALHILSPLFLTLVIAAILANFFQTGPVFSATPLSPDLSRISPSTGFKRLFSFRTIYETIKSLLKLIILGMVGYLAIRELITPLIGLTSIEPKGYLKILVDRTGSVLVKLVLALFIIAIIDFAYTRWEFAKRMRMSRRDVKDESKQREGDPRIRSRIRELRKEMLKRSKAMGNLPSADVLITNPTRLAVALRYQHGAAGAP
jgi:flagellar biosynthesis protein FlhB